jgi:hypothetical protein
MSNHDLTIANGPGINVRQDIEAALQALGTNFQGTAAPLITYPCQIWADASAGLLRIRNIANTAWVTLGPLDTANFGLLPIAGGTITGGLVVNGGLTVGGAVTMGGNANVSVAAGQNALHFSTVAGTRQWYSGCISTGAFLITDQTAGGARLTIDTGGAVAIAQSLSVGASLNVTGLTNLTSFCALTAPNGSQAYYHSVVTGTRDWLFGTEAGGGFLIYDASASQPRMTISTAGAVNINQGLTVGANITAAGGTISGQQLAASAAGGNARVLVFQTNGVNRFLLQCDATAEGGGNAGSNLALNSYDNSGINIGQVLNIVRATRVTTFAVAIVNGPSDRSLKENIQNLEGSLDRVLKLQGVSFNYIGDPTGHIGLIAQDVQPIVPEVMQDYISSIPIAPELQEEGGADAVEIKKLAIDYPKLTALLIEAVKELSAKVTALEGASTR